MKSSANKDGANDRKRKPGQAFNAEFIQKLEKIRFVFKKLYLTGTVGERVMRQKGGRIEFAGHRDYSPGDEIRYLDWNAYARSEKLFIKEFAREESVPVYIIIDISASMMAGKIDFARQLAIALGYIGLISAQPVRLFAFTNDNLHASRAFDSDKELHEMMNFYRQFEPSGQTDLFYALSKFDKLAAKKGFLIMLSDLFENLPAGREGFDKDCRRILERLVSRGFLINIMHVSSGFDEIPRSDALYKLRDSESGEEKVVWVDNDALANYQHALLNFSEEWNTFCRKHNIKYFYLDTRLPIEDVIFKMLRQGELLR